MKVLVIGGGGREHAICWKLKQSQKIDKLYAIPGNAGISEIAECINYSVMDFDNIIKFSLNNKIDLVFVAPDDPLYNGLVNKLNENGIRAFGPLKDAAIIEGSKAFSKDFMKKYNIPTADYEIFNNYDKAKEYVKTCNYPVVIKADGLALGKGVIICNDLNDAENALIEIMQDKKFGQAGNSVVIEEFMQGKEVSLLVFTDGKTIRCMPSSQDHKKAYDNDKGLNTGGMGAFSPSRAYTDAVQEETYNKIIVPTIQGMIKEGRKFMGVLYFGLMLTDNGVKVLEYNARFGDPETQALLPLLKTDLFDIINAIIDEKLADLEIEWENKACVCVILASGGYPEEYKKGYEINIGKLDKDIILFHSGTKLTEGKYYTNGGRVLGVAAVSNDMNSAREKVYDNINNIEFKDMHFRKDIGIKL